MTRFDQVLDLRSTVYARTFAIDLTFVKAYACLFYSRGLGEFKEAVDTFLGPIDAQIIAASRESK